MSRAQNLPQLIIERIVEYGTCRNRTTKYTQSSYKPERPKSVLPYLHLCQTWRAASLPYYYKKAALDIDEKNHDVSNKTLQSKDIYRILSLGQETWVKHFHITISIDQLTCNSGASALDSIFENGKRHLLHANELIIKLCDHASGPGDSIEEFYQAVDRAMPNRKTTLLYVDNGICKRYPDCVEKILQIGSVNMQGLFFIFNGVAGTQRSLARWEMPEGHFANLRFIYLHVWNMPESYCQIVRRSHQTVESLKLKSASANFITLMTQSPLLKYPMLREFRVTSIHESVTDVSMRPSGILFPRLESLECPNIYPFSSDVLLHADKMNLKHVDMWRHKYRTNYNTIGRVSINWLEYPKLKSINLTLTDAISIPYDSPKLIQNILHDHPSIQSIRCENYFNPHDCLPANINMNLRVLKLRWVRFSVSEIIEMVQKFPFIEHLAVMFDFTSSPMSSLKMIRDLQRADRIIARSLGFIEVYHQSFFKAADGQAMVTLASLFPSLRRLRLWHNGYSVEHQAFTTALEVQLFNEFDCFPHIRNIVIDRLLC